MALFSKDGQLRIKKQVSAVKINGVNSKKVCAAL